MLRASVLATVLPCLAGCSIVLPGDRGTVPSAALAAMTSTPAAGAVADPMMGLPDEEASAGSPSAAGAAAASPRRKVLGGSGYTVLKVGAFDPRGDLSQLDSGFYAEAAFGSEVLPFLAVEASLGYLQADGDIGPGPSTNFEVEAVPLMVQARASLPVLIFEPYLGVGIGGMYVDGNATSGPDFSDFVVATNAFGGVAIGLGNLAVGIEAKYIQSSEVESAFEVEGWATSLLVTLPF